MAKPGASEPVGTPRTDLKRLLKLAREEPVHAAFGLGGDGKPIIILDKRKQPRALEKSLKDQAADAKNIRFGSVTVDPDEPKLACFMVNKAASGMARKLVIALKGTGINRIQIVLEDGTPCETAESEDDEEQEDAGGTAGTSENAGDDPQPGQPVQHAAGEDSETANGPAKAEDPGEADSPAAQPDAAALTADLTGLVKRMVGVIAGDPSQKTALAELATDAQASLKGGDLAKAAAGIEVLREALGTAGPADASGPGIGMAAPAPDLSGPDLSGPDGGDPDGGDPSGADPSDAAPSPDAEDDSPGSGAPASPQDAAAVTAALTDVVKQLMPSIAADPSQANIVRDHVVQARASLQAGDLGAANGHVDSLRAMLDDPGTPQPPADAPDPPANASPEAPPEPPSLAAPAAPPPPVPAIAKARVAWLATRQKIEGDLGKLHGAFATALQGHSMADELGKSFRTRVDTVMDALDEALAHKLDEVNGAGDAGQRSKLVGEAQTLIQGYQSHIASDPTIAALDSNPFAPLAIQKTMTMTLATLAKAIR